MNYFKNLSVVGAIALIVLIITIALLWPFAIIAALNTLFPLLSIPYSFSSWISVVVLNISTFGGIKSAVRDNK